MVNAMSKCQHTDERFYGDSRKNIVWCAQCGALSCTDSSVPVEERNWKFPYQPESEVDRDESDD